jgi:hypothetical protein
MATTSSKSKTGTKKTSATANISGCGCWLLILMSLGWLVLLFLGPLSLIDRIDASNTANELIEGKVSLVAEETLSGNNFYVLTIVNAVATGTTTAGTNVKAIVQPEIYKVADAYCRTGNCYAKAEYEANDGLYKMELYETQGGALLARINNHSQEKDDLEIALFFTIGLGILSLIIIITYILAKAAGSKKKTSSAPIPRLHWNGQGMPPQGGVTSAGEWYLPPPSAVQLYSAVKGNQVPAATPTPKLPPR